MARITGGIRSVSVDGVDIREHLVPLDPPDPVRCEHCGAIVTSSRDAEHDVADETRMGDTKMRIFVARCLKEPLLPCACRCGKMVAGGHMEAAHPEDYRYDEMA